MRNYEIAFVADPELDENALTELETRVTEKIKAIGGSPGKVDRWGRRRLAYPIRRKKDGYYVFIQAEMPETAGQELERELRMQEPIMRFLLTLQTPTA
ncbi:MAG: 30S ribosomal protein S6 [Anaerolineales bacterium]